VPAYFGGSVPWITPTDITKLNGRYLNGGKESITETGLAKSSAKLLPENSVLLTSRATIGFTAINSVPVSTNQGFANFICGPRIVPDFLAYVLEWMRDYLIGLASGATFKEISKSTLKRVEIPLPPLEEQLRIVALLDRVAEIRRRTDAAHRTARTIISTLFVDMFGDPATNPKGWEVTALGEVLEGITGGKNLQAGTGANSLRILKVSAVTSGRLKPDESKPAPNGYLPPHSHFVRRGDFLFTRANTSELVGATTIVDAVPEDLLLPDKIWRINWREERVRPTYMLAYMQGAFFRRLMSIIASGTSDSMKNISQAKLRTLPVAVPPLSLQRNFEEQVRGSRVLAQRLSKAAQVATNTQTALSAEVFK
jgi:type I restriction enzyme S subunit